MRVIVEYTCDWSSENGDDSHGQINVTTPTGRIHATWRCEGGKGRGAEVRENTTTEYTDEEADEIVNATDTCQGIGTFTGDLLKDQYGWLTLTNVEWPDEPALQP